jgi:hypothetical protein
MWTIPGLLIQLEQDSTYSPDGLPMDSAKANLILCGAKKYLAFRGFEHRTFWDRNKHALNR